MYMDNLGVESPMFDYVEQICGRTHGGSEHVKQSKKQKKKQELIRHAKTLHEKDHFAQVENQEFYDNEDDTELALAKVDQDEVTKI